MNNFFSNCTTPPELKKAYRRAAMKHHPDHGGSTATMQRINVDYEARMRELTSPRAQEDTADEAQEAVDLREYERKVNAQHKAYNERLKRRKAELAREMEADPLLAELIGMTGKEINFESKLIEWICRTDRWYDEAWGYILNARATLRDKGYFIRWEYGPAPTQH